MSKVCKMTEKIGCKVLQPDTAKTMASPKMDEVHFLAFLSSGQILSCLSLLFTGYMRQHKVVLFNLKGKQISARLHTCLPALYNLLEMNIYM